MKPSPKRAYEGGGLLLLNWYIYMMINKWTRWTEKGANPSIGIHETTHWFTPVVLLLLLMSACDSAEISPTGEDAGWGADAGNGSDDFVVRVVGGVEPSLSDLPDVAARLPTMLPADCDVYDLGMVSFSDGLSPEIQINLPSDATGFGVSVYGHDDVTFILSRLHAPDGAEWVTDNEPEDITLIEDTLTQGYPAQFFSPARVLPSVGSGSYFFPNTPDIELLPGQYSFWLDAQVAGELEERPASIVVLIQRRPERLQTGAVKLTIHFADGDLDSDSAPDDPFFQSGLQEFLDIYQGAGLFIDDIVYRDVLTDAYETIALEDEICNGGDFFTLFREAILGEPDRLHVVLVDRFQCLIAGGVDIGQTMGGLAGGIPGTLFSSQTAHHGVAVASQYLQDNPDRFGLVLAHEVAHFLGLFHVRERDVAGARDIFDIIQDTGEDDSAASENLMDYQSSDGISLSLGQSEILLNHPLVYARD
jgi:hypothetical protein